jgi:hypothetical protein
MKIPSRSKLNQMVIKYMYVPTYIFHSKALQNIPKLAFLVCKYAIWQPWVVSSQST